MSDWLGLAGQRVVVAGGAGSFGAALVRRASVPQAREVAVIDVAAGRSRPGRPARRRRGARRDRRGGRAARRPRRVRARVGINRRKPIEEYTDADWDDIVADQPLERVLHRAAPRWRACASSGYGRIVFFSSVAGRSGHKHHGPYAATKGAINQLMRVMAHEYAADGVTVNAVAPGYMDTELTRQYLADHPGPARGADRADPGRPLRAHRRGGRPGAVPVLPAGELHHRDGPVHRRREERALMAGKVGRQDGDGHRRGHRLRPAARDRAAQEGAARVIVHYRSSAAGAEQTAARRARRGRRGGADPGRHLDLGRDQADGRARPATSTCWSTTSATWRPSQTVVARARRGGDRPRASTSTSRARC